MTGERGELIWKQEEVVLEIRRRIRKQEAEGTRVRHGDGSTTRIQIGDLDGWEEVRNKIQNTTARDISEVRIMLRGRDIEHRARGDLREIGPEEELVIMERLEGGAGRRKGRGKTSRRDPSSEKKKDESGEEAAEKKATGPGQRPSRTGRTRKGQERHETRPAETERRKKGNQPPSHRTTNKTRTEGRHTTQEAI